jgi:hypothetical protein
VETSIPDHVGRIARRVSRPIDWDCLLIGGSLIRWRAQGIPRLGLLGKAQVRRWIDHERAASPQLR